MKQLEFPWWHSREILKGKRYIDHLNVKRPHIKVVKHELVCKCKKDGLITFKTWKI